MCNRMRVGLKVLVPVILLIIYFIYTSSTKDTRAVPEVFGQPLQHLQKQGQPLISADRAFQKEASISSHEHKQVVDNNNKMDLPFGHAVSADRAFQSVSPHKQVMANKMDPSYHDTKLRLGTDLNFSPLRQCPSDSYMQNATPDGSPQHSNCPTLFIVGARKGGTSSLYQYISKHPDFQGVRLDTGPKVGETFYFSNFYTKWSWEKYISLFPSSGEMTGDSSVANLVHHLVPKRLYQACGKQAKVVMLLRDPSRDLNQTT